MLSVFYDLTKKEKRGQQQLTMAIYPFQYPDYATVATDATTGAHAYTSLGTHLCCRLAMRPDLHHLLCCQVDGTKLKDLEFQFLHRSPVSKLRLDRLLLFLPGNKNFLSLMPA